MEKFSDVSPEKAIEILKNEVACVVRASDGLCDRDCGKCDLVRDTMDIVKSLQMGAWAVEELAQAEGVKIITAETARTLSSISEYQWFKQMINKQKKDVTEQIVQSARCGFRQICYECALYTEVRDQLEENGYEIEEMYDDATDGIRVFRYTNITW